MFTDWDKVKTGPTIDLSALKQLDQFDAKSDGFLVRGVLNAYLQSTPGLLRRLRLAASSENMQDVFHTSHNLKSSSDNIGARKLAELCKLLETSSHQNCSPQLAKSLTEEIVGEAEKVLADAETLLRSSSSSQQAA